MEGSGVQLPGDMDELLRRLLAEDVPQPLHGRRFERLFSEIDDGAPAVLIVRNGDGSLRVLNFNVNCGEAVEITGAALRAMSRTLSQ